MELTILNSKRLESQASDERFIYSFMVSEEKSINFNGLSASNQSLIDDNVIIIRELPFHSCTDIYSQNQKLIQVLIHSRTSLALNYLSFSTGSQREIEAERTHNVDFQ